MRREVICRDALVWLQEQVVLAGHIVTSLPGLTEMNQGEKMVGMTTYRAWFQDAVAMVLSRLAPRAIAIFYQTDACHDGVWLDKAYLIQRVAENAGCHLLYHKIVLFSDESVEPTCGHGCPSRYTHLLAFSKIACADEPWFVSCEYYHGVAAKQHFSNHPARR